MRKTGAAAVTIVFLGSLSGCAPKLSAPHQSVRISGTVEDVAAGEAPASTAAKPPTASPSRSDQPAAGASRAPAQKFPVSQHMPLGVAVYEACSPQLYFFRKCPGRFLGEAKLTKPGAFVVEIDASGAEIVVFGFRGFLGPDQEQEACDEIQIPIADAAKPIALKLKSGTCSIKLERRYG